MLDDGKNNACDLGDTTPVAGRMPAWIEPQLAGLVKAAPDGDPWLHEIKVDGTACMRGSRPAPRVS